MKLLLAVLGASACASVAPIAELPSHGSSHANPRIEPVIATPAGAFPRRRSAPELPSLEALHEWWRGVDQLSADVRLCVTPDGRTSRVELLRSSGDRAYDDAILVDSARWRYEPFVAAGASPVCEPATVTYLP